MARGVIRRIQRGEIDNECQREVAMKDFPDVELDVPNIDVPDNQ